MHDLDRTQLEYGSEFSEYAEVPEYSSEGYEYGESGTVLEAITGEGEGTWESGYEYEQPSTGEVMEDELASELLEISSEAELDHFLGKLISKAASGVGRFVSSPAGQALGGILKQVASKALPIAGGAFGTLIGGPAGSVLGSKRRISRNKALSVPGSCERLSKIAECTFDQPLARRRRAGEILNGIVDVEDQ